MTQRFAIYYAPARDSLLGERAQAWLAQPEMQPLTVSARHYGFHATMKAPMALAEAKDRGELEMALAHFAADHAPARLDNLAPRMLGGFLALTTDPQPAEVTKLGGDVMLNFEAFRAPLTEAERARRLRAPLTPRQIDLLDAYGYQYVLDEFLFHMTLSDELPEERWVDLVALAREWFETALAEPILLDRLVLFTQPEAGAPFERLEDYLLTGKDR
jgi:hypothetical protein